MKFKKCFKIVAIFVTSFILISWGSEGHYKINNSSQLSFNAEMQQFMSWASFLAEHASDADYRKDEDPTESPKHYIDIDNYSGFILNGQITMSLTEIITLYGQSFVYDNGILPWATLTTYDTLVNCFERRDWNKAMLTASDLGHYVADGHMPLHLTQNYNGGSTGNYGIHSRYESTMINDYVYQIIYNGREIEVITDVQQYIFDYIYANYVYVDSVIDADNYAKGIAGNTSSQTYTDALWFKTKNFTTKLFSDASNSLAEIIYTAWVEAGSPSMTAYIDYVENKYDNLNISNYPNPFSSSTTINYYVNKNSDINLKVLDIKGNIVATLVNETQEQGDYSINWIPENCESGIYFVVLKSGNIIETKSMIFI